MNHILFPYDFSGQAALAAPFVRAIAGRFGASVTLIGVVPPVFSVPPAGMPVVLPADAEQSERTLKSRLDRVLEEAFAGFTVHSVAVHGDPALKIVEYAHGHDVDLIMMPTHGLGIFRSMLIGSVTAKVLHDARCPVWTATHAEEQRAPAAPRLVLCAVDGASEETVALARWASEFSKRMDAAMKLLHVVPPISDWLAIPSERELQEQVREEARGQLGQLLRAACIEAPLRVAVGKITETVTEEARQEGAGLLVIGRGSAHSALGRLRSHTYGIVQQSPCPVLSR